MKTVNLNVFTDEHGGIFYLDNQGNIYEPDDALDGLGKFRLFKKIGNVFKRKPQGSKVGNFFRRTFGKKKTEGLVVDELEKRPRESALLTTVADTINQSIVNRAAGNRGYTQTPAPNLPPPPKDNDKLIKGLAIGGVVLVTAGGVYALAKSNKRSTPALSGTSKKKKSGTIKPSTKKKPTTRRTKTKKAA